MDPRFFLPCFHGPRDTRLGHKKKEKVSVHNLPYGPRTRLIRGIYHFSRSISNKFALVIVSKVSNFELFEKITRAN